MGAVLYMMDKGATVTTLEKVDRAEPMPPSTSSQKAELMALTRALELGQEKRINIYTDSYYPFAMCMYTEQYAKKEGSTA